MGGESWRKLNIVFHCLRLHAFLQKVLVSAEKYQQDFFGRSSMLTIVKEDCTMSVFKFRGSFTSEVPKEVAMCMHRFMDP